jgi:hypothetical protein
MWDNRFGGTLFADQQTDGTDTDLIKGFLRVGYGHLQVLGVKTRKPTYRTKDIYR